MIESKERKREIGLRVIGLCMVYIRGLERGSERNRVRYIKTYGKTTYILAERVGSRKKDNPRLMFTTIFFKKKTN